MPQIRDRGLPGHVLDGSSTRGQVYAGGGHTVDVAKGVLEVLNAGGARHAAHDQRELLLAGAVCDR